MCNRDNTTSRTDLLRFVLMGWLLVCFALIPMLNDAGLELLVDSTHPVHEQGGAFNHSDTHHHEDDALPLSRLALSKQILTITSFNLIDFCAFSHALSPLIPPPKI